MLSRSLSRAPLSEHVLLGFLLLATLLRGGKSLEVTWMLVALAAALLVIEVRAQHLRPTGSMQASDMGLRICAFGFLVWTLGSYLTSSTKNYGLDELLRDGALVLIFLWTMRYVRRSPDAAFIRRFAFCVVLAALLAVLLGVLVYALQPVNRFVGSFFDYRFHTDYWPNAWAQYLLLSWPMILLLALDAAGRARRTIPVLLGLLFGALLLSYSRGALIACVGQLALLAWCRRGQQRRYTQSDACMVALTVLIASSMFFGVNALRAQFHPVESVAEKVTFTADEGASSVSERKAFWSQSLHLSAERPVLGWGPYSFRFVHQKLQTGVLQTSDHPHNLFLKIAVERGVAAALLLVAMFVIVLLPTGRSVFALFRYRHNSAGAVDQRTCLLAVVILGVLAHNLIDYNLQFVGIALPFWIALGLLAHRSMPPLKLAPSTTLSATSTSKKSVQLLDLSIAIILLLVALREGGYLVTSSLGRHAEVRSDHAVALRWYDRSLSEWFSRDLLLSRALLATLSDDTLRAEDSVRRYALVNAEDPRGWRLRGDAAMLRGDLDEARDAYTEAYHRGRWNDLSITYALAEALRIGGHTEELFALKPEIDALLQAFVEAITRNAHFIALSHNAEDAIALTALLKDEYPKDAPRYDVLAARADFAMRRERLLARSRPPGYLW